VSLCGGKDLLDPFIDNARPGRIVNAHKIDIGSNVF
jgi:hypothetical protein